MSADLAALMGEAVAPGMRIGLLGGSYNPAHDGHLHISLEAKNRLALDQVWWLVSPQNPLKSPEDMAPIKERLKSANAIAANSDVRVTDIEVKLGTQYTADTLTKLIGLAPGVHFVWLMGADNLVQLPRWRRWRAIMESMPMAIFNRDRMGYRALAGAAAARYGRYRVRRPAALPLHGAPAWCFLFSPLHTASSTAIRANAEIIPSNSDRDT